jgi:hypothetical protein
MLPLALDEQLTGQFVASQKKTSDPIFKEYEFMVGQAPDFGLLPSQPSAAERGPQRLLANNNFPFRIRV